MDFLHRRLYDREFPWGPAVQLSRVYSLMNSKNIRLHYGEIWLIVYEDDSIRVWIHPDGKIVETFYPAPLKVFLSDIGAKWLD